MPKMPKMLKMLRRQTIIEVQTPRVQPRRPILLPWAGQEKVGGGGPPRGVTIKLNFNSNSNLSSSSAADTVNYVRGVTEKAKKVLDTTRDDASKLAFETARKQAKKEVAKARDKAY